MGSENGFQRRSACLGSNVGNCFRMRQGNGPYNCALSSYKDNVPRYNTMPPARLHSLYMCANVCTKGTLISVF